MSIEPMELVSNVEALWPLSGAEPWDAPGFSVSHPYAVEKVLLSVDVTMDVIAEAKSKGANFILSHHPVLLRGTSDANWDTLKGQLIQEAVRSEISLYAAHTNADIVANGVSATIALGLGLQDVTPLSGNNDGAGHGRIGHLPRSISLKELASALLVLLPFTPRGISVAGLPDTQVTNVALCGGAGDSFIGSAFEAGADVYITSDLRHHVTLDAIETPRASAPLALIDISHWAAESLWLGVAAEQLSSAVPEVGFLVSEVCTDPWTFTLNGREI